MREESSAVVRRAQYRERPTIGAALAYDDDRVAVAARLFFSTVIALAEFRHAGWQFLAARYGLNRQDVIDAASDWLALLMPEADPREARRAVSEYPNWRAHRARADQPYPQRPH